MPRPILQPRGRGSIGELTLPTRFTIVRGIETCRPSLIEVEVPHATGDIRMSGTAVALD